MRREVLRSIPALTRGTSGTFVRRVNARPGVSLWTRIAAVSSAPAGDDLEKPAKNYGRAPKSDDLLDFGCLY